MAIIDNIQETYLYDLSLNGGVDSQGNINQIWQGEALSNAIKLWIVSRKGDYLGFPDRGGYVIQHLLKPMTEDRIEDITTSIEDGLANDFDPPLEIDELEITPDYERRTWKIFLAVYCPTYNMTATLDEELRGK